MLAINVAIHASNSNIRRRRDLVPFHEVSFSGQEKPFDSFNLHFNLSPGKGRLIACCGSSEYSDEQLEGGFPLGRRKDRLDRIGGTRGKGKEGRKEEQGGEGSGLLRLCFEDLRGLKLRRESATVMNNKNLHSLHDASFSLLPNFKHH